MFFLCKNSDDGSQETLRLATPLGLQGLEVTKCGSRHQFPLLWKDVGRNP